MCNFISWIEYDNKNYFLTSKDLETKEGKKLLQKEVIADLCGHGAIRAYYPELKNLGTNKECEDFSTPKNFPDDIIRAIKTGQFEGIGICLNILNDKGKREYNKIKATARAEYNKIEATAWAEYNKIEATARAEYNKIEATARAEYKKIEAPAWAEYNKIEATALAEYNKIEAPALAEYDKIEATAWAEYKKIEAPALAEYNKIEAPALAEYNKIEAPAFWKIVRQKKYRIGIWK